MVLNPPSPLIAHLALSDPEAASFPHVIRFVYLWPCFRHKLRTVVFHVAAVVLLKGELETTAFPRTVLHAPAHMRTQSKSGMLLQTLRSLCP